MTAFPLPTENGTLVAPAPLPGPENWAGSPSASFDADGSIVLGYRVRWADGPLHTNVIARSTDGERFETVTTLEKERYGAASLERPALVQLDSGRWRVYLSCATPGSKHWWIGAAEADDLAELADAEAHVVLAGDEDTGVKDPIVRRTGAGWEAWICCHPLDEPGEEDRMTTAYATSADGLEWHWRGTVLAGRPGEWDARGARVTTVLPDGRAAYDGRATKEENWFERTGLASPTGEPGGLVAHDGDPVSTARYLEVLPLPEGGYRIYYEWLLPDESHELRTELVPG